MRTQVFTSQELFNAFADNVELRSEIASAVESVDYRGDMQILEDKYVIHLKDIRIPYTEYRRMFQLDSGYRGRVHWST